VKLSLLNEADMSRRDFLGFLGKGAAAAAGAPLDKVSQYALPALQKLTGKPGKSLVELHPRFSGMYQGEGTLKNDLQELVKTWNIFKRITGAKEIFIQDLNPYGAFHFRAEIDRNIDDLTQNWNMLNIPDYEERHEMANRENWPHMTAAYSDEKDWFKNLSYGVLRATGHITQGASHGAETANSMTEAVKAFAELVFNEYDIQFFNPDYFDQEGLEVLKNNGINTDKLLERHHEAYTSHEQSLQRDKERREARARRLKDRSQPREVGYEKQGQFDPQSSRPAQALGPFESRLVQLFGTLL
jgi:hypothetical protein